jgi:DNA-3-methyladenine glycosylase I
VNAAKQANSSANRDALGMVPSTTHPAAKTRCEWCGSDPLYVRYHDEEWGVPVHDDRKHFEFLILEGAQAGLSWSTILKKRENYREAFAQFDPAAVARFGKRDVARLMKNAGIVRNRLKIEGAIKNARAFLAVQEEFGSFDAYVWPFVRGAPIQNRRATLRDVPATSPESDALSKDLKRRGFTFVGSTIIYAHMQAVGMVNDHVVNCFRHAESGKRRSKLSRLKKHRNVFKGNLDDIIHIDWSKEWTELK